MMYSVLIYFPKNHCKTGCEKQWIPLPFVPYPGLIIEDGQHDPYQIDTVTWNKNEKEFYCKCR
jgi:hypothetical protein